MTSHLSDSQGPRPKSFKFITGPDEIKALCDQIAQASEEMEAPYLALDTEFLREKTYWSQLCLIQIGFQGDVWILDPLEAPEGLQPFFDLLRNQKIMKVFHAARQDLEIFYHLMGDVPTPLFDTQIAAMVCGYQDSVAYDVLVRDFVGVHLDKSSRRTDWSKRPLSKAQLAYAADDVRYLMKVYDHMRARLTSLQRLSWAEEEMASLKESDTYITRPEEAYKRLKLKRNTPEALRALQRLAAWREQEAQTHNQARPFVVTDDALQDLAMIRPKTDEAALALPALKSRPPSRARLKKLISLLHAPVEEGGQSPDFTPEPVLVKADRQILAFLKLLLSQVSQDHKVAEKLIATTKDLEALALNPRDPSHPLHHGWRQEIFTQKALRLLEGGLHAVCAQGQVIFEETKTP